MKRNRTGRRRAWSVILAIWLCITLMPLSAFAAEMPDDGTQRIEDEDFIYEQDEVSDEDLQSEDTESEEIQEELVTEEQVTSDPQLAGDTGGTCIHELESIPEQPATCQHSGVKAYRRCKKCGKFFAYTGANPPEVDYQSLIIPVADHKWDAGTVIKKATIDVNGIKRHRCTVCGSTYDEEIVYKANVATGKSFTLKGNKLSFKQPVAKKVLSFMKDARIADIWIKAGKKKITVYWDSAKNMNHVDGVIILRKTGKSKVYKEIKRIKFRSGNGVVSRWSPKYSFADKTAKKKNKAYTYVIVSYFSKNGLTYISNCSEWAAGQTTASKLKNAYKAKLNSKSLYMQSAGTSKLKVNFTSPKKSKAFMSSSIRWYSDNKNVAKVSKKGKVTAVTPGTTTVYGRLPSGKDIECTVEVVGAFKPSTPSIWVDVADNHSISLVWRKATYATSYDLYRTTSGSTKWKKIANVDGTSKKVTGLTKGVKYRFYVIARNDNNGYTAYSDKSNIVSQKAVIKRRPTTLSGWPRSDSQRTGTTYSVTVRIGSPDGREARLQKYENYRWATKKTISLPYGAGTSRVRITFPSSWSDGKATWRLYIPHSKTSEEYTTRTLVLRPTRRYQNPGWMIQISDSISKHGYRYYVSPVLVNSNSTRGSHVEALIRTANKYKGDSYVNGKTGAPGNGIDASGLVIQACYGAGVDLWPISPATRPSNCVPKIMSSKLQSRTYTADHRNINRGDLIFFYTGRNLIGHVAIYLGYGKILHASMVSGRVENSTIDELIKPIEDGGKYGYSVAGCRRIFN